MPAGAEVVAHVYERPDAPAGSAPSTESVVEVPETQPLPAAAGEATVGSAEVGYTLVCPATEPAVAVTVAVAPLLGAVKRPELLQGTGCRRPCEGRLRGHLLAELVKGRCRQCLRLSRRQTDRAGADRDRRERLVHGHSDVAGRC